MNCSLSVINLKFRKFGGMEDSGFILSMSFLLYDRWLFLLEFVRDLPKSSSLMADLRLK